MTTYTPNGWPVLAGTDSASTIDDYSLELGNKLEAVVPFAMAAGLDTITVTAATSGSVAITFPVGRFTQAPHLAVTIAAAPGGSNKAVARYTSVTTAGASLFLYSADMTSITCTVNVAWIAVQMDTASASG